MKKRVLSVVAITVALVGCALGMRPYVVPTSGPIAYLRVVHAKAIPDDRQGGVSMFKYAEDCRERYFLQGPAQVADVTKSFAPIPAGAPLSIAIHEGLGGLLGTVYKYCTPVFMFTPEQGRYYRATVTEAPDACQMRFESAGAASFTPTREEPFKSMRYSKGFDENSSWCGAHKVGSSQ